jgi:hypothetical protein
VAIAAGSAVAAAGAQGAACRRSCTTTQRSIHSGHTLSNMQLLRRRRMRARQLAQVGSACKTSRPLAPTCADLWPPAAGPPPPPPAGPPPPPPPFVERLGVTGTDTAPGGSGEEHGPAPQHMEAAVVISATYNALSMLRARTHAAPAAAAAAGLANDPVLRRRLCSGTQGMRMAHVWGVWAGRLHRLSLTETHRLTLQ